MSLLVTGIATVAPAQTGPSVSISYDFLPYQDFSDPVVTDSGVTIEDAAVQLRKMRTSLSYPLVFSQGRTVLVQELTYQLIVFKYRGFESALERLHAASYTVMLQQQLSQKWTMWALGTPSLASDLGAEISEDDFNFQAAVIFIRHFSDRFSIGFGAAYSTQFGSATPLPVLGFDWNNGKNLMAKAILPVSLEFWYRPGAFADVGFVVSGDGNNFHGDPAVYEVTNPELRYTMLTAGPAAKIALAGNLRMRAEAGIIALHRFEFYDGDTKHSSSDLEPSPYVRVGLEYGQ